MSPQGNLVYPVNTGAAKSRRSESPVAERGDPALSEFGCERSRQFGCGDLEQELGELVLESWFTANIIAPFERFGPGLNVFCINCAVQVVAQHPQHVRAGEQDEFALAVPTEP